jgi:hypothetical protein
MEVTDGEGTPSEILRFAQNDSECIFLPFADFFTPSHAVGYILPPLRGCCPLFTVGLPILLGGHFRAVDLFIAR